MVSKYGKVIRNHNNWYKYIFYTDVKIFACKIKLVLKTTGFLWDVIIILLYWFNIMKLVQVSLGNVLQSSKYRSVQYVRYGELVGSALILYYIALYINQPNLPHIACQNILL